MSFSAKIDQKLEPFRLLSHPYYQDWMAGKLSKETLQDYAAEYFAHVQAFPRYVSSTHSLCENIKNRQVLLENLVDEEQGEKNHPELWMRFAEGLGCDRAQIQVMENSLGAELAQTIMKLCRSSYAEGLAALYTYETQIPEIAESKISGLKEFYQLRDERSLEFFEVHLKADVYHAQACREQLDQLSELEKAKAERASELTAKALWFFLDGVQARRLAS